NPEEVVPEKALSLTKTGRLSRKKMTKTNYYRITQDYVCSMSLQVAKIVFARLPIEKVIVNTTENRLNTATGNREDIVVLSVAFEREIMDRLNYENIDPADAMQNFEHHMKHLKTAGFKPVEKIEVIRRTQNGLDCKGITICGELACMRTVVSKTTHTSQLSHPSLFL